MNVKRRKIGSLFIIMCMILNLFPMSAIAEGDTKTSEETPIMSEMDAATVSTVRGVTTTPAAIDIPTVKTVSGLLKVSQYDDPGAGYNLEQDHSGVGWSWIAGSSTLTIDSNFNEARIYFECDIDDIINLQYEGDIAIINDMSIPIYCGGILNIEEVGSGGTLTLEGDVCGLNTRNDLIISSGTINAKNKRDVAAAIYSYASINIKGNANVIAQALGTTGRSYCGIGMGKDFIVTEDAQVIATIEGGGTAVKSRGDIIISGNGSLEASGNQVSNDVTCNAISNMNGQDIIISTNGTVKAYGTGSKSMGLLVGNKIKISSGTVDVKAGGADRGVITGGVYIEGDANVKVASTEDDANVITDAYSRLGINISGGNLEVTAKGKGFALVNLTGKVLITGGVVDLYNIDSNNFISGELEYVGGEFRTNGKTINSFINILKPLENISVVEGDISGEFIVSASVTNSETLSYMWSIFDRDSDSYVAIPGETNAKFSIPTDLKSERFSAGYYMYRCKISSENAVPIYVDGVVEVWDTYKIITVNNGTGSGSYMPGTIINISANDAPKGQCFKEWKLTSLSGNLYDILPEYSIKNSTIKLRPTQLSDDSITLTATYEPLEAAHYSVIVQSDINGVANANVNSAQEGQEIKLTAVPNTGYIFKSWQIDSPNQLIISGNVFTMPNEDVKIKAIFESISADEYTIIFDANEGEVSPSIIDTISNGKISSMPIPTRKDSYSFSGWYTQKNGGKLVTKDEIFTSNTTLYAHWIYTGGSNGGSSSGGGSSSTESSAKDNLNKPVTVKTDIKATSGKNGEARVLIPDKSISDAIKKMQDDIKSEGKPKNGASIALNVATPNGERALTTTLTRDSLINLVNSGVTNLEINSSSVNIKFDQKSLTEIQKKSSGNIDISIVPKTELNENVKKIIGTRPVYNITVNYGENSIVSNFEGGIVTLSIPYILESGEVIEGVHAVYVDENGNVTRIEDSEYDVESKCVIFNTPHLSMYGVGYTEPSSKFTDINNHWAKESIDYVIGRKLISGTTETTFMPNNVMTRGMLVEALGRLEEIDINKYTTRSFTDVKADSSDCPYIEWAYNNGIINGIGNGKFAPDRAVTREEIAVIIANFAKATGYKLPVNNEVKTYTDYYSINRDYKTSVTAMQQSGIIMGREGNSFKPKSKATRAEVAVMLQRYINLTMLK